MAGKAWLSSRSWVSARRQVGWSRYRRSFAGCPPTAGWPSSSQRISTRVRKAIYRAAEPLHEHARRADRRLDQSRARSCLRDRARPGAGHARRRPAAEQTEGAARSPAPGRLLPAFARGGPGRVRDRIILSGTGTNGSLGLRFVKAEGGIVLVQNPDSAAFPGMPRSAIGTGVVDLVLPPDQMPSALLRLASHPYVRQPAKAVEEATPDDQLHAAAGGRARTDQAGLQRLQKTDAAAPHLPPHGPASDRRPARLHRAIAR